MCSEGGARDGNRQLMLGPEALALCYVTRSEAARILQLQAIMDRLAAAQGARHQLLTCMAVLVQQQPLEQQEPSPCAKGPGAASGMGPGEANSLCSLLLRRVVSSSIHSSVSGGGAGAGAGAAQDQPQDQEAWQLQLEDGTRVALSQLSDLPLAGHSRAGLHAATSEHAWQVHSNQLPPPTLSQLLVVAHGRRDYLHAAQALEPSMGDAACLAVIAKTLGRGPDAGLQQQVQALPSLSDPRFIEAVRVRSQAEPAPQQPYDKLPGEGPGGGQTGEEVAGAVPASPSHASTAMVAAPIVPEEETLTYLAVPDVPEEAAPTKVVPTKQAPAEQARTSSPAIAAETGSWGPSEQGHLGEHSPGAGHVVGSGASPAAEASAQAGTAGATHAEARAAAAPQAVRAEAALEGPPKEEAAGSGTAEQQQDVQKEQQASASHAQHVSEAGSKSSTPEHTKCYPAAAVRAQPSPKVHAAPAQAEGSMRGHSAGGPRERAHSRGRSRGRSGSRSRAQDGSSSKGRSPGRDAARGTGMKGDRGRSRSRGRGRGRDEAHLQIRDRAQPDRITGRGQRERSRSRGRQGQARSRSRSRGRQAELRRRSRSRSPVRGADPTRQRPAGSLAHHQPEHSRPRSPDTRQQRQASTRVRSPRGFPGSRQRDVPTRDGSPAPWKRLASPPPHGPREHCPAHRSPGSLARGRSRSRGREVAGLRRSRSPARVWAGRSRSPARVGAGRSRSRSPVRPRGVGRSRSRSPVRPRGEGRSRSRSRGRGGLRPRSRSGSPLGRPGPASGPPHRRSPSPRGPNAHGGRGTDSGSRPMSLGERSLLQALQGLASKQMHGALSRRLQDLAEHLPTDKTDVKDVLYKEIVLSMCTMYLADPKDVTSNRKVTLQEVYNQVKHTTSLAHATFRRLTTAWGWLQQLAADRPGGVIRYEACEPKPLVRLDVAALVALACKRPRGEGEGEGGREGRGGGQGGREGSEGGGGVGPGSGSQRGSDAGAHVGARGPEPRAHAGGSGSRQPSRELGGKGSSAGGAGSPKAAAAATAAGSKGGDDEGGQEEAKAASEGDPGSSGKGRKGGGSCPKEQLLLAELRELAAKGGRLAERLRQLAEAVHPDPATATKGRSSASASASAPHSPSSRALDVEDVLWGDLVIAMCISFKPADAAFQKEQRQRDASSHPERSRDRGNDRDGGVDGVLECQPMNHRLLYNKARESSRLKGLQFQGMLRDKGWPERLVRQRQAQGKSCELRCRMGTHYDGSAYLLSLDIPALVAAYCKAMKK